MKKIFLAILILCSFGASAQNYVPIFGHWSHQWDRFDNEIIVPRYTTTNRPAPTDIGQWIFNTDSSKMQYSNGSVWVTVGSGGTGGGGAYSSGFGIKFLSSTIITNDTAANRKQDSTIGLTDSTFGFRINGGPLWPIKIRGNGVKYSDTASMLAPYSKTASTVQGAGSTPFFAYRTSNGFYSPTGGMMYDSTNRRIYSNLSFRIAQGSVNSGSFNGYGLVIDDNHTNTINNAIQIQEYDNTPGPEDQGIRISGITSNSYEVLNASLRADNGLRIQVLNTSASANGHSWVDLVTANGQDAAIHFIQGGNTAPGIGAKIYSGSSRLSAGGTLLGTYTPWFEIDSLGNLYKSLPNYKPLDTTNYKQVVRNVSTGMYVEMAWPVNASGVSSVSGTANRITSSGGANPVIDISSTFEALLGKVANPLSQFAPTTSSQFASTITDETGAGLVVLNNSPTFIAPILSATSAGSGKVWTGSDALGNGGWQTPASGFADPTTTNGDLITKISGTTARLAQGANGTFLGVSGGVLGYYVPGGSAVTSVFGRTGAVIAAANDYTFAQLASKPTTIAGYGITDAVSLTGAQTLTNKTMDAGSNTFTGFTNANLSGTAAISNANLANSSITINGTAQALGSTYTTTSTGNSIVVSGKNLEVAHPTTRPTATVSGNTTFTLAAGDYIEAIWVDPTSTLTSFQVGTTSSGSDVVPNQSAPSGTNNYFVGFRATATTTLYFQGITSSTVITLVKFQ